VSRTLAETEAQLALIRKRREVFDRITGGRLTKEEEDLERERLFAISAELAAIEEKNAPAPKPKVYPDAWRMSREQAAAKAAELRALPAYYKGPGTPDEVGRRMTENEYEVLVDTVAELMDRATESDSGAGS
jgi:hypothetical protein